MNKILTPIINIIILLFFIDGAYIFEPIIPNFNIIPVTAVKSCTYSNIYIRTTLLIISKVLFQIVCFFGH